jgi:acetyltransferase-like isoleucine patch superfamily enzyme
MGRTSADAVPKHMAWDTGALLRFTWTLATAFVAESVLLGVSALPALAFVRWHAGWGLPEPWHTLVLSMSAVPAYLVFSLLLMMTSAAARRILGWRPVPDTEMSIAELGWPLCDWARYQIAGHIVGFLTGGLLRSTPVWSMYVRLNGARIGRRVWINSVGVTDHCLLDLGDDVVIGAGVHMSGHTVEHGVVKTAPVRIGAGSTVGVNAHVEIGADIGPGCQIGSLAMVPKYSVLRGPGVFVGVPARRVESETPAPGDIDRLEPEGGDG